MFRLVRGVAVPLQNAALICSHCSNLSNRARLAESNLEKIRWRCYRRASRSSLPREVSVSKSAGKEGCHVIFVFMFVIFHRGCPSANTWNKTLGPSPAMTGPPQIAEAWSAGASRSQVEILSLEQRRSSSKQRISGRRSCH